MMSSRRETRSRSSQNEPAPTAGKPMEEVTYTSVGRAPRKNSSPSSNISDVEGANTTPVTVVEEDAKVPANR